MVHKIEIILCWSEKEALLKENALIRELKPEYNRAKKFYDIYYYLALTRVENKYRFYLGMKLPESVESKTHLFGAFKEHGVVRSGTGALLRQLYLIEHQIESPFNFPHTLMNKFTPASFNLSIKEGIINKKEFEELLFAYLHRISVDLLSTITEIAEKRDLLEKFIGKLIFRDLKSMDVFFRHRLERNRQIKNKLGLSKSYIPQENLDDCLIKASFKKNTKNRLE